MAMSDFYEESEGNYWEKIKQKKALFFLLKVFYFLMKKFWPRYVNPKADRALVFSMAHLFHLETQH